MSDISIYTLVREVIERIEWEAELEHPGYAGLPLQPPPVVTGMAPAVSKSNSSLPPMRDVEQKSPTRGDAIGSRPSGTTDTTGKTAPSFTVTNANTPGIEQGRAHALSRLKFDLEKCTACGLSQHRSRIVFSDGTMTARIAFVGDFPSREEDMISLPFIGQRGHLLNKIILAIGQRRDTSYLCNVIKCSPPEGRFPSLEEINTCSKFLFEQLTLVRPEIIVAMGQSAASVLLNRSDALETLRGKFHKWRDTSVMPTWSLSDMLATPALKREVWSDLKQVKAILNNSGA